MNLVNDINGAVKPSVFCERSDNGESERSGKEITGIKEIDKRQNAANVSYLMKKRNRAKSQY